MYKIHWKVEVKKKWGVLKSKCFQGLWVSENTPWWKGGIRIQRRYCI